MLKVPVKELNMDIYVKSLREIYKDKLEFVEQVSDTLSQKAIKDIKDNYNLEMKVKYIYPFKDSIQIVLEYVNDSDLFFNYVFYTDFKDLIEKFSLVMHFDKIITNYLIYRIHKDYLDLFMINTGALMRPSQMFVKNNIFIDSDKIYYELNKLFLENPNISSKELKDKFDKEIIDKKPNILVGIINYLPEEEIDNKNIEKILKKYIFNDNFCYFDYSLVLKSDIVSLPNISFSKTLTYRGGHND